MQINIGLTGLWANLKKDCSSTKVLQTGILSLQKNITCVCPVLYMWHLGALTFKTLFSWRPRQHSKNHYKTTAKVQNQTLILCDSDLAVLINRKKTVGVEKVYNSVHNDKFI